MCNQLPQHLLNHCSVPHTVLVLWRWPLKALPRGPQSLLGDEVKHTQKNDANRTLHDDKLLQTWGFRN